MEVRMPRPAARRPFRIPARLAATALLAASVVGCGALAPSKPPPWTGADVVGDVSADAFVGSWRVVALNPPEGDPPLPERTVEYAADGTYAAEVEPTAEMAAAVGDGPIRSSGSWRVSGGRLVNENGEVELSGDDPVSRLMSRMMKAAPAVAASAEIYEVGPERIVVVTDDGHATAFERLR